jgi:hypothetical protein
MRMYVHMLTEGICALTMSLYILNHYFAVVTNLRRWVGRGMVVLAAAALYSGLANHLSLYTDGATAGGFVILAVLVLWCGTLVVFKLWVSRTNRRSKWYSAIDQVSEEVEMAGE